MMKKTFLGVGLILLAAYVVFRDYLALPSLGMPLWTLIFVLGFGFCAIQNFLHRSYIGAYSCAIITFIILENHYEWLDISTGTIVLASILAGVGLSMVFKPKRSYFNAKGNVYDGDFTEQAGPDTVFSNRTRYVNDENFTDISGDVVFSGTSIYFDNAAMLEDRATYSGDAVFSNVKLYVPRNWNVEFTGDRVFSNIKVYPNGTRTEKTLAVTGDFVFSQLEVIYI